MYTDRIEWPEDELLQQLILAWDHTSLNYFLQVNFCQKYYLPESKLSSDQTR